MWNCTSTELKFIALFEVSFRGRVFMKLYIFFGNDLQGMSKRKLSSSNI